MEKRFQIYLEIEDENLKISNVDIDFEVVKTSDFIPNFALVSVWNIDEKIYQILTRTTSKINLIYSTEEWDCVLIRGNVDSTSFSQKIVEKYPNTRDILSTFTIIVSKTEIENVYVNQNFRDKFSTTEILELCAKSLGLTFVCDAEILPSQEFPYLKVKGAAYSIISKICTNLSLKFSLDNDALEIFSDEKISSQTDYKFNKENSLLLQKNNDEFELQTDYTPELNFSTPIDIDFEVLNGIFLPKKICTIGNNYEKKLSTFITI